MFRGESIQSKLEVQWSPVHKNKFITWGPDVRLYEVVNINNPENSKNNITPKGVIIEPNHNYIID